MKTKEHRFTLVVKTNDSHKSARLAVLCAFASRKPDDCEFHLHDTKGDKEAWMAGAKSGTEVALGLAAKAIERLRETAASAMTNALPR